MADDATPADAASSADEADSILPELGASWRFTGASLVGDGGPDGGVCAELLPPSQFPGATPGEHLYRSHVGIYIDEPPAERVLRLSFEARVDVETEIGVHAYAHDGVGTEFPPYDYLERWSVPFMVRPGGWRQFEQSIVLPSGTERMSLWIVHAAETEVRVARPELIPGEASPKRARNLRGAGVLRATANVVVAPKLFSWKKGGTVTFPVPLTTEHQVPLTFRVEVTPPEALVGYRWIEHEDGINRSCEVEVRPMASARVAWVSDVLVTEREDGPLPPATIPFEPEEGTARWLRATACVQSDDEDVAAKSASLRENTESLDRFVRGVLRFTKTNRGDGGAFRSLDAATAIHCGGSCTSRANLAAALLRAGGVPARTSAHLPTWSGPLYEHWHVEYWHPGVGWTWIEPTQGRMRPKTTSMVVINVAMPEDEDEAFHSAITGSGVAPGVARHAVHEIGGKLKRPRNPGPGFELRGNEAYAVATLDGTPVENARLLELARARAERMVEWHRDVRREVADPETTRALRDAFDSQAGVTAALLEALVE